MPETLYSINGGVRIKFNGPIPQTELLTVASKSTQAQ